jgi:hypothetical protein
VDHLVPIVVDLWEARRASEMQSLSLYPTSACVINTAYMKPYVYFPRSSQGIL